MPLKAAVTASAPLPQKVLAALTVGFVNACWSGARVAPWIPDSKLKSAVQWLAWSARASVSCSRHRGCRAPPRPPLTPPLPGAAPAAPPAARPPVPPVAATG